MLRLLLFITILVEPGLAADLSPALQWVQAMGGSGVNTVNAATADAAGNLYIAGTTSSPDFPVTTGAQRKPAGGSDVFAVKLDPFGNVVYSITLGGASEDSASAVAVGTGGSFYITGSTSSGDFPVTPGVYAKALTEIPLGRSSFVLKLNPDGSLGWSTYFAGSATTVHAIAVDSAGNPFIAGETAGNLPTTAGAYQTQFQQTLSCNGFFCVAGPTSAFVTRFNAQGTGLLYSTYVPTDTRQNSVPIARAMLIDAAGNTWLGGEGNVVLLNAAGSALLASAAQAGVSIAALALDANSNVYATGSAKPWWVTSASGAAAFPSTPGAFQPLPQPAIPLLPYEWGPGGLTDAFIIKWDSGLSRILAATLLGGELDDYGQSIAIDAAGNVIVSGKTDSKAFPTRSAFQSAFSSRSGFIAGLDSNLSSLLYSTYLGDARPFDAVAAALDGQGNILLAGSTLTDGGGIIGGDPGESFTVGKLVVANKIQLPPASAVRLDSVVNFASNLARPLAPGEPFLATGSGFGPGTQILIDGLLFASTAVTATTVSGLIPDNAKTSGDYTIQIITAGNVSNTLAIPAAPASPALFSANGTGYGQGYILNSDGSLNSTANPASPGSAITIFATGVGLVTLDNGAAVTALSPSVFIDGFYANGISASSGAVAQLPGNVYRISVYVPDPALLAANNPDLANFKLPPQVGVKLVMGDVVPSNTPRSAMISQPGIVLNVK